MALRGSWEQLSAAALARFGYREGSRIIALAESSDNVVFLVDGASGFNNLSKAVLRISKRPGVDVQFEVDALQFLTDRGSAVVTAIPTTDGKPWVKLSGDAVGVLFPFVEGATGQVAPHSYSPGRARQAGLVLGDLHRHAVDFVPHSPRRRTAYTELQRVIGFSDEFQRRYAGGARFVQRVEDALVFAARSAKDLPLGLLHNDYRPQNVLFDDRDLATAVIDWDWSCFGPLISDLALGALEWSFADGAAGPHWPSFEAFLEGYCVRAPDLRVTKKDLFSWIAVVSLASASTYLCDRLYGTQPETVETSYMFTKHLFFSRMAQSGTNTKTGNAGHLTVDPAG